MATKKKRGPGRPKGSKTKVTSKRLFLKIMKETEGTEYLLQKLELSDPISTNNAWALSQRMRELLKLAQSIEAKANASAGLGSVVAPPRREPPRRY